MDFTNLITPVAPDISQGTAAVLSVIGVAAALASCFFGYRLMKFWIACTGFILGAAISHFCARIFIDTEWIIWVVTLVIGAIVAMVAFNLYLAGVFILCGGLTYLVVYQIFKPAQWWAILICVIAAFLVGTLAVTFVRPVTILSTAIQGGVSAMGSMLPFFKVENSMVIMGAGLVVAVVGIIFQFATTRHMAEDR